MLLNFIKTGQKTMQKIIAYICIAFIALLTQTRTLCLTYEQAGVSIDTAKSLVDIIKPLAKETARPGTFPEIGGFSGICDLAELSYKDPLILCTTDGVGTKLKIAQEIGIHDTIGIDLVAMNVNDLLVHGAEPLACLLYTSPSPRDGLLSRMPSSA